MQRVITITVQRIQRIAVAQARLEPAPPSGEIATAREAIASPAPPIDHESQNTEENS